MIDSLIELYRNDIHFPLPLNSCSYNHLWISTFYLFKTLPKARVSGGSYRSRIMEVKHREGHYDKEDLQVPFNTPETLSSSSSAESSPDLPRRREKVLASLQRENILHQDDDYDHLDFNRQDQLETFCRSRLNRVTGRTLYIVLMEMRRQDVSRDRVLQPALIDQIIQGFGIPLGPCMKQLHDMFRDDSMVRHISILLTFPFSLSTKTLTIDFCDY